MFHWIVSLVYPEILYLLEHTLQLSYTPLRGLCGITTRQVHALPRAGRTLTPLPPAPLPSLPSAFCASQDSFRSRLNFHHISIMFPKPGIYYVGVYNNDVYIKEQAIFSITARWSVAGNLQGGFCPADCNGHGKCLSVPTGPTCECNSNYGGNLCEGRHSLIKLGSEVIDELQPAQWAYYRLNLQDSNRKQWGDGLLVEFNTNMMGHPVLIVKRGGYPSMLNNDYIFTSSQMLQGRKRFKLEAADLGEGDYIFGIFNMDYYKHNKMEYTFLVRHTPSQHGFDASRRCGQSRLRAQVHIS